MGLEEHPGYFGMTSRGVMAIHADWPAYPLEHGWETAVVTLGSFPQQTEFEVVDDIDQCALLLAPRYGRYGNPYDERSYHCAIWHEGLVDAHERGLVAGVQPLTRREHEKRRRDQLRQHLLGLDQRGSLPRHDCDVLDRLGEMVDGQWVPVSLPLLETYDDYVDPNDEPRDWLGVVPGHMISLTDDGWNALDAIWAKGLEIPQRAQARIQPLIDSGMYDTAVRELGVIIESRIRSLTGSAEYGIRLVDGFFQGSATQSLLNTGAKILRSELRTAFKFVRNEFAHNVIDLPRPRAMSLIGRMCHALAELEEFGNGSDDAA
ncbi:hypothetical protein [Micromonospora sp. NBC_01813]|uniref:hypothetical protein n=1 Tax=Micromonospora sp. NBC_01813 TaxID=2975988 RepID=UPI002DDB677B|nr:hypothetical protein [Micromonospora sp. NBC_01813]WSA06969.1 TIGR02391 family protein [Micromonospora sp. NBC_01813]